MKYRVGSVLVAISFLVGFASAQKPAYFRPNVNSNSKVVQGYQRTAPDRDPYNNYSYPGDYNNTGNQQPALVLNNATYFGGTGIDYAGPMALDPGGNLYVAGQLDRISLPEKNPTPLGAANAHAIIAKFDPAGRLLALVSIGGSTGLDQIRGIAVNATGVYVTGETWSKDFPTKNPLQSSLKSDTDMFVTKLSLDLKSMEYSTFLGGNWVDSPIGGIAVDSAGNAFIAGRASEGFPLVNPIETDYAGIVLAKISSDGSHLIFSTYFGRSAPAIASAITVDKDGNAFMTGYAGPGFPVTPGAIQATEHGNGDAFVAKFSPGGQLLFATYLGGSVEDSANSITTDSSGDAYVTGWTTSPDFPLVSPVQNQYKGGTEGFITRINAAGTAITWSTFLGDSGGDEPTSVAVDQQGRVYVEGEYRPGGEALVTTCHTPEVGPSMDVYDVFIAVLNPALSKVETCTILPSTFWEYAGSLALDSAGNVRTVITSFGSLPPYQAPQAYGGDFDLYVASYRLTTAYGQLSTELLDFGYVPVSTSASRSVTLSNGGTTLLSIESVRTSGAFSQMLNCPATLAPNTSCTIDVSFKAPDLSVSTGWVSVETSPPLPVDLVWLVGIGEDFKIGVLSPSLSVKQGQSASIQVELTPVFDRFDKPVSFSCTGLPAQATCSFTPSSVTPGSNAVPVTMTISTRGPATASQTVVSGGRLQSVLGFCVVPFAAVFIVRRGRQRVIATLIALVLLAMLVSCGGGGASGGPAPPTPPPTPPSTPVGMYTVEVVGSCGSLDQSAIFTLQVTAN